MSSTDPNGGVPAAAQPETIAVVLTREQAYAASCALADSAHEQAQFFMDGAEVAAAGDSRSADAQACGRRLLGALESIGYPHAHAWEHADFTMLPGEAGRTPWGARADADGGDS